MNKLVTMVLLVVSLIANGAPNKKHINGKLKDKQNNEVLAFATITLKNNNDSIIAASISNVEGEFTIDATQGNYMMSISFVGYKTKDMPVVVANSDLFIGTIKLEADNKVLGGVTVKGKSQIAKIDRDVHVVTKEMKRGATNVESLLPKIRGIDVDPMSSEISLDNDKNVLLLVDGSRKDASYIKNISPDRILRVEVIRNPTGKYLTQGYNAVINMVLKRNYAGYQFYGREKNIISADGSNGDDLLFSNHINVGYTYVNKNLNIYGKFDNSITNNNLPIYETVRLGDMMQRKVAPDEKLNVNNDMLSYNMTLGMDAFLSDKHSLSIEATYKAEPEGKNIHTIAYKTELLQLESSSVIDQFTTQEIADNSTADWESILAYKWTMNKRTQMSVDYGFSYNDSRNLSSYVQDDVANDQLVESDNYFSRLEVDFTHKINDKHNLNAGYRNTFRNNISSFGQQENTNKQLRNTAYGYLDTRISDKINTRFGAAFELVDIHSNEKKSYFSAQPFVSAFYKATAKTNYKIKFQSGSSYPTRSQLVPFEIMIDRLQSQVGAPNLSISNNYVVMFEANFFNNMLSIKPYYSWVDGMIDQVGNVVDNRYVYTYDNIDLYEKYGAKISTGFPIVKKRLMFKTSVDIFNNRAKYKDSENSACDYLMRAQLSYTLPKTLSTFIVMSQKQSNIIAKPYGTLNDEGDFFALIYHQPLFKRRLELLLFYTAPISLNYNYDAETIYEHNNFRKYNNADVHLISNLLMVRLNYRFGKGQSKRTITKKELIEREAKKGLF